MQKHIFADIYTHQNSVCVCVCVCMHKQIHTDYIYNYYNCYGPAWHALIQFFFFFLMLHCLGFEAWNQQTQSVPFLEKPLCPHSHVLSNSRSLCASPNHIRARDLTPGTTPVPPSLLKLFELDIPKSTSSVLYFPSYQNTIILFVHSFLSFAL